MLFVLFMPETYAPVMLGWKAKVLRDVMKEEGRDIASLDGTDIPRLSGIEVVKSIGRPFVMLMVEPILDLFALYLVLVWVVLFGFLPGYGYIFGEDGVYGLDQVTTRNSAMRMNNAN